MTGNSSEHPDSPEHPTTPEPTGPAESIRRSGPAPGGIAGFDLRLNVEVDAPFDAEVDEALLRLVVERSLAAEQIAGSVEVTLVITDDEEVRHLNAAYRGIDETTDVLSFPLEAANGPAFVTPPGEPRHLGDVVVSYPRAERQAAEYGHSVRRELAYLVVHGTLHLLGYDHEAEAEREVMRAKEEAALADVPRDSERSE